MPSLGALFSAVRMSCHFLPLNSRVGRSIRLSSATCTLCQPSASVTSAVARLQEKMYGTRPALSHSWTKSLIVEPADTGRPDRVAEGDRHARVLAEGEVALAVRGDHVPVLRPGRHPGDRVAAPAAQQLLGDVRVASVPLASRRLLRRGTRKARRPRISTIRNAR